MAVINDKWIKQNGDQGQTVESQEMYDSDMDAYLQGMAKSGRMERFNEIKNNISVMKKWWKEGK